MASKTFIDEFEADLEKPIEDVYDDYNEFKNKSLLEELRNKIIQTLIDNNSFLLPSSSLNLLISSHKST